VPFCFRPSFLLLVGFLVIGSAGRSEADSPKLKQYYWQAGNPPFTLWSTSKGYCFLTEMEVGSSRDDSVSVSISNGYWVLSGAGTAQEGPAEFGIASCVAWPEGFNMVAPQFGGAESHYLSDNSSFCSLAGVTFDGRVSLDVPQFRIMGYPNTQTYVNRITQEINDDSHLSPPHGVSGQCIAPSEFNLLYWGGANPGHTIANYHSNYGAYVTMTGANTLCAPQEVQAEADGPIYLATTFYGGTWHGSSSNNIVAYYGCINYPGPVVQMDAGNSSAFIDATGPDWAADQSLDSSWTATTSNTITTDGADGPAPPDIYRTVRYYYTNFQYTFYGYAGYSPHVVRLHFAEAWLNGAGLRRFNVLVNGARYLTDFDVWSAAGGLNKATVQTLFVNASSSGQIQILFTPGSANAPMVSGIEIQ
jgi:hypothetical protein